MVVQLRSTVQRVINRLIAKDAPGELANQGLGDISPNGNGWFAGSLWESIHPACNAHLQKARPNTSNSCRGLPS